MFLLSFLGPEFLVVLFAFGFYAIAIILTALFVRWLFKINESMSIQKEILNELIIMNGKQDDA